MDINISIVNNQSNNCCAAEILDMYLLILSTAPIHHTHLCHQYTCIVANSFK